MKLHLQQDAQYNLINGYGQDGIVVRGQHYRHGLLVAADWLQSPWGPESAEGLGLEHFNEVLARKPDVMLLGTGKKQHFPLQLMAALGGFAATLSRAVVVLGEIQRPSGELFEPVGRVLS